MNAALVPALEAAVPLHMLDVGAWTPEQRIAYCYEHAQDIASRSDVLMFGGKKGEAAQLFNVLARALACLAFQPGGVKLFGLHFDAQPRVPDPELPAPPPLPGM